MASDNLAGWTPYDFILNGEFADIDHLRLLLDNVRDAAIAKCVILLVYQAPDVFQSLMYVSCTEQRIQDELQSSLVKVNLQQEIDQKEALISLLKDRKQPNSIGELLGRPLISDLFKKVANYFQDEIGCIFYASLRTRRPSIHPDTEPMIGVLCIQYSEHAVASVTIAINELVIAINASAPIYLHRLHSQQHHQRLELNKAERQFEEYYDTLVEKASTSLSQSEEKSPYEAFLTTVLSETRSVHGGLFMLCDDPTELRPTLRLSFNGQEYTSIADGPALKLEADGGVVSKVFHKAQPFLINGRQQFEKMYPRIPIRDFPAETSSIVDAYLAVPIVVRRYKDDLSSTIGVLNIEMARGPSFASYTLNDYWFMIEAAKQVSVAWTHIVNDALLQIVRASKKRLHRTPGKALTDGLNEDRIPLTRDSSSFPLGMDQDGTPNPVATIIPSDLLSCRDDVQTLLKDLLNVADLVCACTVRILSVDQTHIVLLAKCANSEEKLKGLPLARDLMKDKTPIARVMQYGVQQRGPSEAPIVSGVKHWVCLPLILATRCVGVATFGTKIPNAFLDFHSGALQAVADAISEVFESAQTRAIGAILHPTKQVLAAQHTLEKLPGIGLELIHQLEQSIAEFDMRSEIDTSKTNLLEPLARISDCFRLLDECIGRKKTLSFRELASGNSVSIRNLLDVALNDERDREYLKIHLNPLRGRLKLSEKIARFDSDSYEFCLSALRDLIRNAIKATTGSGNDSADIHLYWEAVGRQGYGCISITNPIKRSFECEVGNLPELYRVPYSTGSGTRLHCGAFIAGWLMRSIGGDVHLEYLPNDLHMYRVILKIPLLPRPMRIKKHSKRYSNLEIGK